jgi:hypothetical protein
MRSDEAEPGAGAAECQACPICAGVAMLRLVPPEVVEHLLKAGSELLLAVRALLDGQEPAPERSPGAQRIDIG